MLRTPEVSPLGDSAVLVSLGDVIDNAVYQDVTRLAQQCEQHPFPGYVELVPAYSSLTIIYNPATIDFDRCVHTFWISGSGRRKSAPSHANRW